MKDNRNSIWAGLMILGGFAIGLIGFIAGFFAFINEYDYIGAGLCFLASAISFGLQSIAIFRK